MYGPDNVGDGADVGGTIVPAVWCRPPAVAATSTHALYNFLSRHTTDEDTDLDDAWAYIVAVHRVSDRALYRRARCPCPDEHDSHSRHVAYDH